MSHADAAHGSAGGALAEPLPKEEPHHQGRGVARGRGARQRGSALAEPLPKEEPVGEKTLTAAMVLCEGLFGGQKLSELAKLRLLIQILKTRKHPVSQTQHELVFRNTTRGVGQK